MRRCHRFVTLFVAVILVMSTGSFDRLASAAPYVNGKFTVSTTEARAVTSEIVEDRTLWPDATVDVHNEQRFWTAVTVGSTSNVLSHSKVGVWATLGLVPPEGGARYRVRFDGFSATGTFTVNVDAAAFDANGIPTATLLTATSRVVDLLLAAAGTPFKVKNLPIAAVLELISTLKEIDACAEAGKFLIRLSGGVTKFAESVKNCFLVESNAQLIAKGLNRIFADLGQSFRFSTKTMLRALRVLGVVDLARDVWDSVRAAVQQTGRGTTVLTSRAGAPACANLTPSADQVVLFSDRNFGGKCSVLGLGDYRSPTPMGIGDNSVSSVRVGVNVAASLYAETGFKGTAEGLIQDDPDLGDNRIGSDTVSSVRVRRPGGDFRVVLTWAQSPADLDSHLWLPNESPYHVYYSAKGNSASFPFASLDIDDRSGLGPETIKIEDALPGTYTYAVHNYSGRSGSVPFLSQSRATVRLFQGDTLLRTYNVPTVGSQPWWDVFRLEADGTVTDVNRLTSSAPVTGGSGFDATSDAVKDEDHSQEEGSPTATENIDEASATPRPPTATPSPDLPTTVQTTEPTRPVTEEPTVEPAIPPTEESTGEPTLEVPSATPTPAVEATEGIPEPPTEGEAGDRPSEEPTDTAA